MAKKTRQAGSPRPPRPRAAARERTVRLSQTIVPFGVGSVVSFLNESFVCCDTTMWRDRGTPLRAPRLERALRVDGFRSAPVRAEFFGGEASTPIIYLRFPRWLFCSSCRRMIHWSTYMEKDGQTPACGGCGPSSYLVPMRFVTVCREGHLGDVPWEKWAHSGRSSMTAEQKQCAVRDRLAFRTLPGTGGLESLVVECGACGASQNLKAIGATGAMGRIGFDCPGRQPWQKDRQKCLEPVMVVQRGATNVTFPRVRTGLDIPPESDFETYGSRRLQIVNDPHFSLIRSFPNGSLVAGAIDVLSKTHGVSIEEVKTIIRRELEEFVSDESEAPSENILDDEWTAFLSTRETYDPRDRFIALDSPLTKMEGGAAGVELKKALSSVKLATRLREVRALQGFSRVEPDKLVPPDLTGVLRWLPAIEVYGEGIFIAFDEAKVAAWEKSPWARERSARLEARRMGSLFRRALPEATPRFVALHTLSHFLIRRLSFECGYAASSLRERIYATHSPAGAAMAGILIYTAAGDSEGTLGGLVRQGHATRLLEIVLHALREASWCSADPVCGERTGQGVDGLNLAACHACSLLSETSCVYMNLLLDRSLVIGDGGKNRGLLQDVIEKALAESRSEP